MDILKIVLRKKITELLRVISSKYPDKFKHTEISAEVDIILSNIVWGDFRYGNFNKPNNTVHTTARKVKKLEKAERCNARVWNNIYDRATLKEVDSIDKKFLVVDYNDLKVKEFNARYIVGSQCSRKKHSVGIYCPQHTKHNPHGNYFEVPKPELCLHYIKECGFLE